MTWSGTVFSQACCSAGTPIIGSLALPPAENGKMLFALSYDYNNLNDLYSESEKIDDGSRQRLTKAFILESSYGLSDYFSLNALFSYVQQVRTIQSIVPGQEDNQLNAQGLGDALLMVTYKMMRSNIMSPTSLHFGVGVKAPVGESDLKHNGILLPIDLQPGTGSWDLAFRASVYHRFVSGSKFEVFSTTAYRINGENEREYSVGDEFLLFGGGGYSPSDYFRILMQVGYRFAREDQQFGEIISSTGGQWLDFLPALEINAIDNVGIRLSGQVPLHRDLNGVQLTTTYKFTLSLLYGL